MGQASPTVNSLRHLSTPLSNSLGSGTIKQIQQATQAHRKDNDSKLKVNVFITNTLLQKCQPAGYYLYPIT